jgi:molybdopterin-guanine dinucleotide biosynthesis protein A
MQLLNRSAIILADGSSNKFNCDKGAVKLNGKPLISYVIDAVKGLADEVIVVTNSQESADVYSKLLSAKVKFVSLNRL